MPDPLGDRRIADRRWRRSLPFRQAGPTDRARQDVLDAVGLRLRALRRACGITLVDLRDQ
ncbi:hypothetical protein [Embleya sp. NPDC005575]|uniref:hypothetical protein n=1 Tax=Embleya sp. NPDC005575 TaxID=3156892 RepID=UPI0033B49296